MTKIASDRRPFRLLTGDAVIRDIGTSSVAERVGPGARFAVSEP